jgi:sporulation protein YlmC with PRC-barrel domain
MKNRLYLLSLLLVLALAFTACGTEEQGTIDETNPAIEQEDVVVDVTGQPVEEADEAVVEEPVEDAAEAVEESADNAAETVEDTTEANVDDTDTMEEAPVDDNMADTMVDTPEEEAVADATTTEEIIPPTGAFNINRLSNLYGYNVYNNDNEAIGDIEEIVVDMNTSEIKYVVLGVGGFLGIGEKSVAVPYQALTVNQPVIAVDDTTDEMNEEMTNIFILDADLETLENAPDIDIDLFEQPLDEMVETDAEDTMTLEEQEQAIHTFWQDRLGMTDTADMTDTAESTEMTTDDTQMMESAMMASYVLVDHLLDATLVSNNMAMDDEIIDDDVTVVGEADDDTTAVEEPTSSEVVVLDDEDFENVGDIEEVIIDPTTGKVRYLLADLNDDLFVNDQTGEEDMFVEALTPIPLKALTWNAEEETLSIDMMAHPLQDAPTITYEEFDTNPVDDWDLDLNTYWGDDLIDDGHHDVE